MESPKKLFRQFDTDSQNQFEKKIPVCSELFHVYENATETATQLLAQCREYMSLDDHALAYIRSRQKQNDSRSREEAENSFFDKFLALISFNRILSSKKAKVTDQEFKAVKRQLETFVNAGMLIARNALRSKVQSAISDLDALAKTQEPLAILGIPTTNRSNILVRCVESYLSNLHENNRSCRLHIIDDSDEPVQSGKNYGAVKELCNHYNSNLLWIDKSYRTEFANKIATMGNTPKEITQFALLGNPQLTFNAGAARNTLLLLAAGIPSLQTDDDILCHILQTPWKDDGIALSTEEHQQYRFDMKITPSADLDGQEKVNQEDFLSLHEKMLSKHPGALINKHGKINIDLLSNKRLLQKLSNKDSQIAVTYAGIWGDSGMHKHWQRLCLDGDSYQQLIEDAHSYRKKLCTRQIFRGASQFTISDTTFCMGGNIGLNSSQMLPPFMPVQRNEDGIFGLLLYLCFPNACQGYLPYTIQHAPANRPTEVDVSHALSTTPLRTNDILLGILSSLSKQSLERNATKNLYTVGSFLSELDDLTTATFKEVIKEKYSQFLQNQITIIQQYLHNRAGAPDFWQKDAEQVLKNLKSALQNDKTFIPSDLPGDTSLKKLALFKEVTANYGRLLLCWPAIWEAAAELRDNKS